MSLPYFRHWVDNWRASPRVQAMTYEQRGIFFEMLCLSWQIGPLPLDSLPILLKLNPRSFRIAWEFPLNSCWTETADGLVNERLEQEREWAKSKTDKGKRAARHRWNGHADALQTQSKRNASLDPDPDPDPDPEPKKEKRKKPPPPPDIRFNRERRGFEGEDLPQLHADIAERYMDEFGADWITRIGQKLVDWRYDNSEKSYPSERKHILRWFRTHAAEEREKTAPAKAYVAAEAAQFDAQRGDKEQGK